MGYRALRKKIAYWRRRKRRRRKVLDRAPVPDGSDKKLGFLASLKLFWTRFPNGIMGRRLGIKRGY